MAKFTLNLKNYIKSLVYDKDEIDTALSGKANSSHEHGDLYYTETEIDTMLGNKASKDTATTSTDGLMSSSDKTKLNGIDEGANKTTVDSTLSDSSENPVQNKTVKSALDGKAASTHSHTASEITDSSAHSSIGTSANATQSAINSAIDSKISALLSVELISVVASEPTASADTMNKLYLIPSSDPKTKNQYDVEVTVKNGDTYSWEQIDKVDLDLSGYMQTANFNLSFDETNGILECDY